MAASHTPARRTVKHRSVISRETISGRDLSDMWSSAIIFAPHLAGCMCAGGFHVPLDPAAVEEDLIDFLRYRYKSEGLAKLAAFTNARAEKRDSSFNVWLRELDDAKLSAADKARLIEDLRTTLDSMNVQGTGMGAGVGAGMGRNSRGEIICY